MTTETTPADLAQRVEHLGALITGAVEGLAALVGSQLSGRAPRRADLAIGEHCLALLERADPPLAGAGFVAANGVLRDAPYWLEWWTATPDVPGSARKLAVETDPTSIGFRDYTELAWFVTPRDSGRLCVTGPYVDYMCTDQHTLTTTVPVTCDGVFVGVVGVDLLAATMERLLLPALGSVEGVCVVVNAVGRVVASSDPQWVVGDLVRGLPFAAWFGAGAASASEGDSAGWSFTRCRDLPLGVLSRQ
jgi:Methyl-accepting chemotaxis protein-like, first PDC sensor domain